MSFVEKHKVWLLPVLGAGVLAVGWFNYQSFQPKPAPPAAPTPVAEAPAPAAPPVGTGSGVWDDLKPLAAVPPSLADLGPLESIARGVLSDAVLADTAEAPSRLRVPRLWQPNAPSQPEGEERGGGEGVPAPDPDLVVHLPEGGRAWFDGAGYRERDGLRGSGWRVRRILPQAVELQGPGGVALKPVHPATSSHAEEENR